MKSFFLALCAMLTILLSNAQQGIQNPKEPTPQEIYNLLNMSAEFNGGLTIKDLDHPWMLQVGQTVTYQLQDGHKLQFVAEKGDNFWNLGKKALKYQTEHPENPIVKPDLVPQPTTEEEKVVPPVAAESKSNDFPWWGWIIVAVAVAVLIWAALDDAKRRKARKEKEHKQPVLVPLVDGGVNDAQAPAYMQSVARRKNYTITGPTESILLTTIRPITMDYYGGITQPEEFTNEPFFQAPARRNDNGQACFARFRQTCGNDGTVLNESDIIVTRITDQSPEIRQANAAVGTPIPATAQEVMLQQMTQPVSTIMKAAALAEEHIAAGNTVVYKLTNKSLELKIDAKEVLNLNSSSNHKPAELTASSTEVKAN